MLVRDVAAGSTEVVSRATGSGAGADRAAGDASISDDGNRVAFVSAGAVLVADNAFSRSVLNVRAGAALQFHWVSAQSHNVTVLQGPERFRASTRNGQGADFRRLVETPGRYTLVCTLHEPGMQLTVNVR